MDPIVEEMPLQRSWSVNVEGHRTWTRGFRVIVDRLDGPQVAAEACPVALWGEYEGSDGYVDPIARCNGGTSQCVEITTMGGVDVAIYEVTANYGFIKNEEPDDPFSEPAQIRSGANRLEEIVDFDIDGVAILNSAIDPYDPPVTRDDSRPTLSVTQNEPTFNGTLADAFRDTLNSAPFLGAPAGTVKCSGIDIDGPHYRGDVVYYVYSYNFEFNRNGWKARILDRGMRQLNDEGDAINILDADGQPISEPMCLDGTGHKMASDGDPVQFEYTLYESADFSVFNLRL